MATKKLSIALKALTTPEFGAKVEMPSLSLNGVLVTPIADELNFVDGVTSPIQTQLNDKAALAHTQSGATITTDNSIVSTRYPQFTTTARGAAPMCVTATGSQVLADNGWKKINNLYTAFTVLVDGTPISWDMATDSYNAVITLVGNRTLLISNMANGMSGCLVVIQDGTGGRTLALPANSKTLGGVALTLTSVASSRDVLTWFYDGTFFYWSIGNNYA